MIVLDANVMIAVLDSDDAFHGEARQLLVDNISQRLVAHRLTMAESLVLASRRDAGAAAASALSALGVVVSDGLDDPASLADLRASTGLPMPDCCVLHATIREKAHLATFDRRLAAAARAVGVVVLGAE